MVMHHSDLDFAAICSGYADGWSLEAIHALRESLLPHAQLVAEQVSTQWVMDARRANVAEGMHQEDVTKPVMAWSPAWNLMLSRLRTNNPYFRWLRRQPMPPGSHN